jgi:Flp pilus assembly protein TadG
MKRTRIFRHPERGTQIAELALVLPLLLLIVAIIVEGSGFVRVHQVLNNAAREGARIASLDVNQPSNGDHTADIRRAVAAYACNNGVALTGTGIACANANTAIVCNAASITVLQNIQVPTPSGIFLSDSRVTATCTYRSQFIPNVPFFGISSSFPLTGTAEFQNPSL